MRRVAPHFMLIACGFSLVACAPNLPALQFFATASPVPSLVSRTTSTPAATPASAVATSLGSTATFTPIATFTPTVGATSGVTQTLAPASTPATETAIPVESVSLDKLPPGTVYRHVRIEDRAHLPMDISLHCTTIHGLHTVIEYNNVRSITVQAPEGNYVYVFYVGGHRMMGSFSLLDAGSVTLTVYKDRVAIH